MAGLEDIPLFPPMCVYHQAVRTCEAFGISVECVPTFPLDVPFTVSATHGHLLTVLMLTFIGLLNLSHVDWSDRRASFMKIQTSLYALITAAFAFFRLYWGVSQFLLIGAAIHNLFEWFFFIQVSAWVTTPSDFWRIVYKAMFFIVVIMVLIVAAPTLIISVAIEQAFGIMMDFGLVLAYSSGYLSQIANAGASSISTRDAGGKKTQSRADYLGFANFYAVPLLAHGLHLTFTILPLVFVNFHAQSVSWYSSYFLEGAIYLSAPITHTLYMHWGIVFDRIRDNETIEGTEPGTLPKQLRVKKPTLILLIAFLMGQIPLVVIPQFILGDCPAQCSDASPVIVSTAVASVHDGFGPAWEAWVATNDLENTARQQKGNLYYQMSVNRRNPNEYRFVEHWDSQEALNAWSQGFPKAMFSNKITQNLLKGGKLNAMQGYRPVNAGDCTTNARASGALRVELGASCDKVWATVSDWDDCTWVDGCTKVTVSEQNKHQRSLSFEDGSFQTVVRRKVGGQSMIYEVVNATHKSLVGEIRNLKLTDGAGGGCSLNHFFTISEDSLHVAYDYAQSKVIPALQKLFAK